MQSTVAHGDRGKSRGARHCEKSTLPPRLVIFGSSKNQEKPSGSTRTCLEHAYNSSLAATITIHVGFNSQIEGMISETLAWLTSLGRKSRRLKR
jgi:hypothetical protein